MPISTHEAIQAVNHLQQLKERELTKYKSTPFYTGLIDLPFEEVVSLLKEAATVQVEDRINFLKQSA